MMNSPGSTSDRAPFYGEGDPVAVPSLTKSLVIGALGFCFASLLVFATVAFAERWMYTQLGLYGAYLIWTILFILLGGGVLLPLVTGRMRGLRFYLLFGAAFFMYAVGWVGSYFTLRGPAGEWVGSLAGSVLMGAVFAAGFGVMRSALSLCAVLFVANSIGYFVGAVLFYALRSKSGMLLWGVIYGLSLGAGLGAVLHLAQARRVRETPAERKQAGGA